MAPSLHRGLRAWTAVANPRPERKTGDLGHSSGTEENI